MAIPGISALADVVGGLVTKGIKPILDKIAGDKMSEAEKAQAALEAGQAARDGVLKEQDQFFNFVIQHSGAAKDLPKSLQWLRGSVRPVITYLVVLMDFWVIHKWFNTPSLPEDSEPFLLMLKLLFGATMIVLGFWFGERMLTRSGLVQALIVRKNNKPLPPTE